VGIGKDSWCGKCAIVVDQYYVVNVILRSQQRANKNNKPQYPRAFPATYA
jgi:hypothetical protein